VKDWVEEDKGVTFLFLTKSQPLNCFNKSNGVK